MQARDVALTCGKFWQFTVSRRVHRSSSGTPCRLTRHKAREKELVPRTPGAMGMGPPLKPQASRYLRADCMHWLSHALRYLSGDGPKVVSVTDARPVDGKVAADRTAMRER